MDAARLARRARVLEARLSGGRLTPVELGSAMLVSVEREGVVAGELRIPVSGAEELELELVVEDGEQPAPAAPRRPRRAGAAALDFFESKEGAPVEARLGRPGAQGPALRPGGAPSRPDPAPAGPGRRRHPGPRRRGHPAAVTGGDAAAPGAVLDAKAFRHARPVAAAEAGLVAVRLDADGPLPQRRPLRPPARRRRRPPAPLPAEQRDEPLAVPLAEQAPAKDLPAGNWSGAA